MFLPLHWLLLSSGCNTGTKSCCSMDQPSLPPAIPAFTGTMLAVAFLGVAAVLIAREFLKRNIGHAAQQEEPQVHAVLESCLYMASNTTCIFTRFAFWGVCGCHVNLGCEHTMQVPDQCNNSLCGGEPLSKCGAVPAYCYFCSFNALHVAVQGNDGEGDSWQTVTVSCSEAFLLDSLWC
jgi:hypothetical protein